MRPQPKPTRKARMDAKKRARERSIFKAAELRHDALVRSGGTCEACGAADAIHLHHRHGFEALPLAAPPRPADEVV